MKERKRFLIKLLSGALALTATFALGSCDLSGGLDGLLDGILPDSEEHVHNWSEWEELALATCEEDGEQRRICLNVGCDVILEIKTIPALGHQYENGFCETCNELDPDYQSEGLKYELSSDEASYIVTDIGTCTDSTVVIPSVYNDLPVTSIGSYAFEECTSLTSVVIGSSVTSIGSYAFAGCDNLQYNEYDNGYYLGNENNKYIVLVKAKDTSITSCTIHEDTKFIHNKAFYYCDNLTSVVIGDSVTSIGSYAFAYCTSLTSVYYKGTAEEWAEISVSSYYNTYLTNATRYYYSETEPTDEGNYWHYDENGEIVVW